MPAWLTGGWACARPRGVLSPLLRCLLSFGCTTSRVDDWRYCVLSLQRARRASHPTRRLLRPAVSPAAGCADAGLHCACPAPRRPLAPGRTSMMMSPRGIGVVALWQPAGQSQRCVMEMPRLNAVASTLNRTEAPGGCGCCVGPCTPACAARTGACSQPAGLAWRSAAGAHTAVMLLAAWWECAPADSGVGSRLTALLSCSRVHRQQCGQRSRHRLR